MKKRFLFVINPISGGKDKANYTQKIKKWGQQKGHEIFMIKTIGKNDPERINTEIDKVQAHTIVAVGGDGTVLLCAKIAKQNKLQLAILPAGSANGMSAELGISSNISQALKVVEKGKTINMDLLLFNDKELGMHISDIGLNALLVKNFDKTDSRGLGGYASEVIDTIKQGEKFTATIEFNNETIETTCLMIAFGNARKYGTGAVLNKKGKPNDGLFEVCILKELPLSKLAGHFLELINDTNSEHIEIHQVKKVNIKMKKPISFQIDGEPMADTDALKVEIVEGCVTVLVP